MHVSAFVQRIRGNFSAPLDATVSMSHWLPGEAVVSAHRGSSTQFTSSEEAVFDTKRGRINWFFKTRHLNS